MPKYNHRNINRTQHRQLVRLFEETTLALEKGDGAVALIWDRFDLVLRDDMSVFSSKTTGDYRQPYGGCNIPQSYVAP